MIYTFRIISGENDQFIREIEIDSQARFLDFHNFLNSEMRFNKGELASFFITNQSWHKTTEITLLNMLDSDDSDILIMGETKLGELISEKKQRLLYAFDLFSERVLFLELVQIQPGVLEIPRCIRRDGDPPPAFSPEIFEPISTESSEDFLSDFEFPEESYPDEDPAFLDLDEDLY